MLVVPAIVLDAYKSVVLDTTPPKPATEALNIDPEYAGDELKGRFVQICDAVPAIAIEVAPDTDP